jgi:organic radical activating enzyme
VFIGMPPIGAMIPSHTEVHVSCTFTWDKAVCEELAYQWETATNKPVKLGGPAYNSQVDGFVQGMYIHKSIVFTTRGCNNNCPWCCVPKREGRPRELPICEGNVIQDNNILQASKQHQRKVFEMLKTQRKAIFRGGLEPDLIDDYFISLCQTLKVLPELWLACDTDARIPLFKTACEKLVKAGFKPDNIRCYALIGDDMQKNEVRLQEIFNAGALPSAQLFRDFSDTKTAYSKEWNHFERAWQRPAAMKAHMKELNGGHR